MYSLKEILTGRINRITFVERITLRTGIIFGLMLLPCIFFPVLNSLYPHLETTSFHDYESFLSGLFGEALFSAWFIFLSISIIKRLHDFGFPGWCLGIGLIPVALIFLFAICIILPSQTFANRYGPVEIQPSAIAGHNKGRRLTVFLLMAIVCILVLYAYLMHWATNP